MKSDIVLALILYLPWAILRVLSPHPRSTWTVIRICITITHRLLIAAIILCEATNWRDGRPTAVLKDLLQEDMGYLLYLPILLLEGLDAVIRTWKDLKAKTYPLPTASRVAVLAVPDLAVLVSIVYFAYTSGAAR